MPTLDSRRGRTGLMVAHVAGMVDLVALPVWVGTLVQHYGLGPQRAGALVTLFLVAVVVASICAASRFDRATRRPLITSAGYGVAALSFLAASFTRDFATLGLLHFTAGLGVGCGLSFVHGAIGRSANPHRLFAFAQFSVGLFAVAFFASVPHLIGSIGGSALFLVFMTLEALACVVTALSYPEVPAKVVAWAGGVAARMPRAVWFAIGSVVMLTLNQALMFSFVERIGVDRGFGQERVNTLLVVVAFTNLLPGLVAGAMQRLLQARFVGIAAAVAQATLALVITQTASFELYAVSTGVYVFVIIFSHTFLFGLIARLDTSGRAAASTSAMVMSGSAAGPFLAGTLAALSGYPALGYAVTAIATVTVLSMLFVTERKQEIFKEAPPLGPNNAGAKAVPR